MITPGIYEHFKQNDKYEMLLEAVHTETQERLVIYKSPNDLNWARPVSSWSELVEGKERFKLLTPLDRPKDLLMETVKQNKAFYNERKELSPTFEQHGGKMLKYVCGDKIAFALSIRLINQAEAEQLLAEVNSW